MMNCGVISCKLSGDLSYAKPLLASDEKDEQVKQHAIINLTHQGVKANFKSKTNFTKPKSL